MFFALFIVDCCVIFLCTTIPISPLFRYVHWTSSRVFIIGLHWVILLYSFVWSQIKKFDIIKWSNRMWLPWTFPSSLVGIWIGTKSRENSLMLYPNLNIHLLVIEQSNLLPGLYLGESLARVQQGTRARYLDVVLTGISLITNVCHFLCSRAIYFFPLVLWGLNLNVQRPPKENFPWPLSRTSLCSLSFVISKISGNIYHLKLSYPLWYLRYQVISTTWNYLRPEIMYFVNRYIARLPQHLNISS